MHWTQWMLLVAILVHTGYIGYTGSSDRGDGEAATLCIVWVAMFITFAARTL